MGGNRRKLAEDTHVFDFLVQKKEAGLVKHIGFSFHDTADVLEQILSEHPQVDFVQIQLNYLDWKNDTIQSEKCYEVAKKHGKPVVVMEPVKGGTLADIPGEAEKLLKSYHPDMSVASWAIRFAASHENVMLVLSGMSNIEQLKDNLSYMENFKPFTPEEFELVCEAAKIIKTKWDLGLKGGLVIGNPIPEEYALDYDEMEKVIVKALDMAKEQGIHGKDVTPFLLSHIKDMTEGVSFASNLQLAYNNARAASRIACEMAKMK